MTTISVENWIRDLVFYMDLVSESIQKEAEYLVMSTCM